MNILIIRNFPTYMSVKNNTYNIQEVGLAKALVRRGHKCDIVFWTNKEEETVKIPVSMSADGKVTVFYKKGKTALKNTIFKGCDELFSEYDVLQPCEYNQMEAWLLARKYPNKTVIYHGPYYSSFNKRYNLICKVFDLLFLRIYRKNNTQFIVKSKLAEDFLKNKGISNIEIAGVGIDAEMLCNKKLDCNQLLYNKMLLDEGHNKLLYVGRFEERRNIPFIFEVFKKVNQALPDSVLYMIGAGSKDYTDKCWKYARDIGIYDKVVWQEKIEQKYLSDIYKLSDCFLLPTYYEIFGMVLLEAMYYGNLVVTNINGGSSMLITNEVNGIIIDSWDPGEWAEKIIIYMKDKDKRNKITEKASKTIEEYFTWDKLAPIFEKCYLKKLQSGAR